MQLNCQQFCELKHNLKMLKHLPSIFLIYKYNTIKLVIFNYFCEITASMGLLCNVEKNKVCTIMPAEIK